MPFCLCAVHVVTVIIFSVVTIDDVGLFFSRVDVSAWMIASLHAGVYRRCLMLMSLLSFELYTFSNCLTLLVRSITCSAAHCCSTALPACCALLKVIVQLEDRVA